MRYAIGSPGHQCILLNINEADLIQEEMTGALGATLLSSHELVRLICLGHPDKEGEPFDRYDIMMEIKRRGEEVFKKLGWPYAMESEYRNRHIDHVETLQAMYESRAASNDDMSYDEWLGYWGYSIIEHWEPVEKEGE